MKYMVKNEIVLYDPNSDALWGVPLFPHLFQFITKNSELFVKTKNALKILKCNV